MYTPPVPSRQSANVKPGSETSQNEVLPAGVVCGTSRRHGTGNATENPLSLSCTVCQLMLHAAAKNDTNAKTIDLIRLFFREAVLGFEQSEAKQTSG
jgi:hypothetical protein